MFFPIAALAIIYMIAKNPNTKPIQITEIPFSLAFNG
jgi:hypothetical protein